MMLTMLVTVLQSAAPMDEWLPPRPGLAQLFPGDFAALLMSPDRVIVEVLIDETTEDEAPFGPDEAKFSVGERHELTRPGRASVLGLFSLPTNWRTKNHQRCAPNRCVFVVLCGGFRPSLAVTLEKGSRRARTLICLGCGEAWVDRFDSDGRRVGREQAGVVGKELWRAAFQEALSPPGGPQHPLILPARAGTSSSRGARTRAPGSE